MAFLPCVGFSVSGEMQKLRYCVTHPLTRRYVNRSVLQLIEYCLEKEITLRIMHLSWLYKLGK